MYRSYEERKDTSFKSIPLYLWFVDSNGGVFKKKNQIILALSSNAAIIIGGTCASDVMSLQC